MDRWSPEDRFAILTPNSVFQDLTPLFDSPAATKGAEDLNAPIPELVQLGERLGKARMEQGLSLEDLAGRLRLGTEQLMALEAGDHTQLPEAVFVVAQAKRVAGVLGIDISQQISDLHASRMMSKPGKPALASSPPRAATATASPSPRTGTASPPRRSLGPRLQVMLGGGAVVLAGAAAMVILQGRLPSLQTWLPKISRNEPAPVTPPASTPTPAPAPKAAPDQLLLRSAGPSWLEVRDAAGGTLFRGTLIGEKRFPLGRGLRVLAGRPDLVTAATAGGEARPLGRIDQVEWRIFRPLPATP
jgi:cytoskeletal protein RodZ